MQIPIYHINAFTSTVFSGNPAAVCPLEKWLPTATMQAVATENNLSETAFYVQQDDHYEIRWFSPLAEVDLCGHATLATAFVVFNFFAPAIDMLNFVSQRSGELTVSREDDMLKMSFPAQRPLSCEPPAKLVAGLGAKPMEVLQADDYMAVFQCEVEIAALRPDMRELVELDRRGVIVTARGDAVDFVSRFFVPKLGVDEDPVTGSSHCALIPYWKDKLGKDTLHARQVSARGGELFCEDNGRRVAISGEAVKYMQGTITI